MKITQLPSGLYGTVVYIGKNEEGKYKYRSLTDVDKYRLQMKASQLAKERTGAAKDKAFSVYSNAFLADRKPVLSPSTINGYKSIDRTLKREHKEFYRTSIYKIDSKVMQALINELSKSHTPKTVRNFVGYINCVIEYSGSKVPDYVLPKKSMPILNVPDDTIMKIVIEKSRGTLLEIPILLAAFGPMRRGEICALKMEDIEGDVVHVHRDIVRGDDGKWHVKSPKTYLSDRYITYPHFVIQKIMENGEVTKYTPDYITHEFEDFLSDIGVEHFRFHDLRHYSISALHAAGIADSYIMQRGGFSTPYTMQKVYRHTLEDQSKIATEKAIKHFNELL
ncbi:MAG: site-specific integrase [Lachnospiraceae bacterium]|jgi:integrase|nr:site-specific integrase [Lachnospiraceae bacterium]